MYRVKPKVSTIVLNWNNFGDTSSCLSSLQLLNYSNNSVLLIDNGSSDDSAARLRAEYPGAHILETGRNLGFAGGCNFGIRQALMEGADYVWLLNNDTTVDREALRTLVEKATTDSRVAAVGSAVYFMDDPQRIQVWGGGYIDFVLGRSRHFLRRVPDAKIEFLTGASMLISRQAIEAIGLFDEGFFMYWEDADYCFRLRRAGWQLAVAAESKVWHKGSTFVGQGSVNSYRYFNASAARFFRSHASLPFFSFWLGSVLRLGKRIVVGDWEKTRAAWAGITQR
jgi:GT2 family glycosyltransferase